MSTSIHDKSQIKKKKKISKTLSYILRHGALKYRLEVNEYGYIKITDILKLPQFLGVSLDNIFEIGFWRLSFLMDIIKLFLKVTTQSFISC